MFNPDDVGSMVWRKRSDGMWSCTDVPSEDGDSVETVHIKDFEALLSLYREALGRLQQTQNSIDNPEIVAAQRSELLRKVNSIRHS